MNRYIPLFAVVALAGCTTKKTETKVDAGSPPVMGEVRVTHADGQVETIKGVELDARRRAGMKLILGETQPTPATVKVEKTTLTSDVRIGQRIGKHFVMEQMEGLDVVHGEVRVHVLTSGRSAVTVGDVSTSGVADFLEGAIEGVEEQIGRAHV